MNNKKIYQLMMVSFLAILIFSISGLILTKKEKAKIALATQSSLSLHKVNGDTFEVYADSLGKDIVGYDILLGHNSSKTDSIDVLSDNPNFSIFKTEKSGLLIITGTKKLTVKQSTIFTKTKILTIKGISFSIISKSGKETTKLVDSASKIYHPMIYN